MGSPQLARNGAVKPLLNVGNPAAGSAPRPLLNAPPPANGLLGSLERNVVGEAGQAAGTAVGFGEGALDTIQGAADGARFAARLFNPLDSVTSAPGMVAWDQVASAGRAGVRYVQSRAANPQRLGTDVGQALNRFAVDTNPDATPPASTPEGEWRRRFGIGVNQGKLGVGVASVLFGGEALKGLQGASALSREELVSRYLAEGLPREMAEDWASPYEGMGHHVTKRSARLPSVLGGGKIPPWYMDSSLNVLKPTGISKGEMFKLHYGVDDDYHGGRLSSAAGGGGWSGRSLGFRRFGGLERAWRGTPGPMKAVVLGSPPAAVFTYDLLNGDD